ncbi:hypothetical protein IW152_006057 [Coemansia sp. BCRC 34962]|nr:hypothetical protein IW152_006057 [Coemansia sp. BCRC 34962]
MAPIGTIIGPTTNNTRNYKARVVAQFLGIDLATTPDFVMNVDNKKEEYLAKYPAGKVPVFEGVNGLHLIDSSAIAYYVASQAGSNSPLLGQTAEETAEILQYMFFTEADLMPAIAGTLYSIQGFMPYIKPAQQYSEEQCFRFLGVLDAILLNKTFLVGERITIADIILACDLMTVYTAYLTSEDRKKYRNVTRYFKTMINQPAFKAVVGEVTLCVERIKPQPSAKDAKKAEKAEKKAEKKPAEQPKKAEKKAKEVDEDEEMEAPAPKPKSKLDLLPPPKMVLDDWKRFYSNNDTKPDAMNWLWENYDDEGYSFWKVEYKYNDELAKLFMTNNLIGGHFNRLERARKYAFGNLLTLGKDDDNMIWGYFMVRGKEIPEEVSDAADFESFAWTAADHKDPKTRAEIEDCFAWEGPSLPRECYDGKTFK